MLNLPGREKVIMRQLNPPEPVVVEFIDPTNFWCELDRRGLKHVWVRNHDQSVWSWSRDDSDRRTTGQRINDFCFHWLVRLCGASLLIVAVGTMLRWT